MTSLIDFPPEMELQDMLHMIEAEDIDAIVQIQAIKVVAKLTIEEANHQKIVEAGGLNSFLMILRSRKDVTIHKFAALALANLAMNETNHELIIIQGGIGLLSSTASINAQDSQTLKMVAEAIANLCGNEAHQHIIVKVGGLTSLLMLLRSTEDENMQRVVTSAIANFAIHNANTQDPQTLKMIAGAIANLCGNDKLQIKLRSEVGIAALLGMVRCGYPDVLAQVAHGIANFALCETRSSIQGTEKGKSLLIEDGALSWIVQNARTETLAMRRHIELALCYLGKHEANAKEMVKEGAMWELVRISRDSSSQEIRNIAHKTLTSNISFLTELKEAPQHQVVEAGVLTSLLMLLSGTKDETLHKFAASAISILAMNETNQEFIADQGGIGLLSSISTNAQDPQTLRLVGEAIANLCGNDKLQTKLRSEGIAALLGMVRCGHPDVLAQVAHGILNFAFCETKALTQGTKVHKSVLLNDGSLSWIVQNAKTKNVLMREYIELALCHLAKHEVNAKEMVKGKAMWELVRISRDCTREDIRSFAHRTLTSSPTILNELKRLHVDPWVVTDNAVCSSVVIADMDYNFVVRSGLRDAIKLESSYSAQEANLEKLMERSFTKMLLYLRNSKDETVQEDVAFLIANFALSKTYQEQIMDKGCISLLWSAAATAQDPQTITMFAKAIANLCGNEELHTKLRSKGGIAALLEMAARTQHLDVFAEVARGFANFASSESTISTQGDVYIQCFGDNRGKSTLIEDGALSWIIEKAKTEATITIRLHTEIALCRLAQHEANAEEMVKEGAIWELVRISKESSRDDMRILAHQILISGPIFLTELKRICVELRDIDDTSIYRDNNSKMTIEKNLVQHINTIHEVVLQAEKENLIKATYDIGFIKNKTYYKGKEQLSDLFTTLLETTWAEKLKSKLGVTSKWIKLE